MKFREMSCIDDFELADVAREILELELEMDLFDLRVHGIPVWERLRWKITRRIWQAKGVGGSRASSGMQNFLVRKGHKAFYALKGSVASNPFLADSCRILFNSRPRRILRSDGYWEHPLYDPFLKRLGQPYAILEHAYNTRHQHPKLTPERNLRSADPLMFLSFLRRQWIKRTMSLPEAEMNCLREAFDRLRAALNFTDELMPLVRHELSHRLAIRPLWVTLLRQVEPELVVLTQPRPTLVESCSSLGISTLELQHGTITPFDLGYSYPGDRDNTAASDHLFVWGDYWKESVEYPLPDQRVHPVGFPYFDQRVRELEEPARRDRVTFISQTGLGETLSRIALETARRAEAEEIVYKLHPSEIDTWRRQFPWLMDSPVQVVGDEVALYRLLSESKVQVGVCSTVLYEGLALGTRTLLVDLPGVKYVEDLVRWNVVRKVSTLEELIESLQQSDSPGALERDIFFKPHAVEKTVESLEAILEGNEGSETAPGNPLHG